MLGTKLLVFSVARGSGALKGLRLYIERRRSKSLGVTREMRSISWNEIRRRLPTIRKSCYSGTLGTLPYVTVSVHSNPVAPVAYQVILEPGLSQFREFTSPQLHTRINSPGDIFLRAN